MPDSQKVVAIIDDELETVDMLAEMVGLCGHQVLKSLGGLAGLHEITEEKPDIVLLDVMMPELSGLEVLRLMRGNPRLERIPVIVVSARSTPYDIRSAFEAGATGFLTKPVAYQELKKALETAILAAG
jgi:CheY-like chemotaxis protein